MSFNLPHQFFHVKQKILPLGKQALHGSRALNNCELLSRISLPSTPSSLLLLLSCNRFTAHGQAQPGINRARMSVEKRQIQQKGWASFAPTLCNLPCVPPCSLQSLPVIHVTKGPWNAGQMKGQATLSPSPRLTLPSAILEMMVS